MSENTEKDELKKCLENYLKESGDNKLVEIIDCIYRHDYSYPHYRKLRELKSINEKILEELKEQRQCPFRENSKTGEIRFMSGYSRKKGINHIKEKLEGAKSIIICDPYFFPVKEKKCEDYVKEFIGVLPCSVKEITVYCQKNSKTLKNNLCYNAIKGALEKKSKSKIIKLTIEKTEDIHDRVWIVDELCDKGFVVGGSFNGLGNKVMFILDLPIKDTQDFLKILKKIKANQPKKTNQKNKNQPKKTNQKNKTNQKK